MDSKAIRARSHQPSQKQIRRYPPYIYRRRRAAAIIVIVLMLLLIIFLAGACGPGPTRSLQGDQLGPDPEEPTEQYRIRSAESIESVRRETYSLVTFAKALDAETAAQEVDGARRVNAVIAQDIFYPIGIPEPVSGEQRSDVFHRAVGNLRINSVVIYENKDMLEDISHRGGVFSVEALPDDAAWGSFGIRPVMNLATTQ